MSDRCKPTEHDFAPFDANRGMCRKCGTFTPPVEVPIHVCPQPLVVYPPGVYPPFEPAWPNWPWQPTITAPNTQTWPDHTITVYS